MKRFVTTLAAMALLTACFDDPTSDLRGGPSEIRLSRSVVFLNPGASVVVQGTLLDGQGNVLPGVVSFSTADASVATAADVDTLEGQTETSGEITGVAGGATYVRASGGGVTDSIYVIVIPATFTGTIAPATTTVGTDIVISSTSLLTFDPDAVTVAVNGIPMFITAATASSVSFQAAEVSGGTVTISGLKLGGTIDLPGSLDATTAITVTDISDNDTTTALAVTPPAAVGDSVIVYGAMSGADVRDYLKFTMPVTAAITVRIEFIGDGSGSDDDNPDYDLVVCTTLSATGTCSYSQDIIPGNAASSVSNPEEGTTPSVASATRVWLRTFGYYATGGAPSQPYRLVIKFE